MAGREINQLGYRVPILEQLLDEFSPEQQYKLVLSSIVNDSKSENLSPIEAALSATALKSWGDSAKQNKLKEAIGNISNLPDTRRWQDRRARALHSLESIGCSAQRGIPLGDEGWVESIARVADYVSAFLHRLPLKRFVRETTPDYVQACSKTVSWILLIRIPGSSLHLGVD